MASQAEKPADRAVRFLSIAKDYRLGELVTESAHPRSANLSHIARTSTADGLGVLFDVDRDVVSKNSAGLES